MKMEDLYEAHHRFLATGPPAQESKALISPSFEEILWALEEGWKHLRTEKPTHLLGIPFAVDVRLPSDILAVFYSGREPFDPAHPERTVVLRKGGA